MSIYVVRTGNLSTYATRDALREAAEKHPDQFADVAVIEGAQLVFGVETKPQVVIGDLPAVTPARKPRGPAWAPDPKVTAAILDWFMPGVEATIAKYCDETGMARDTATKHVNHLVNTGALVRVSPKTYRAAVPKSENASEAVSP